MGANSNFNGHSGSRSAASTMPFSLITPMPSLRVDRMRTQRDDAEEAACDVGRVGAVGWFGQRVSRNRASSSPSTTAWPKIWRYGFSRTPQSCKVRRRFHRSATSKLGPNSEGRGET